MSSRNNKVKLLGFWASPFATRVRIALNMKSVEYELSEEDIIVSKSDLLLESNPVHKKVPVLIHGDNNPICESLVIVQYVDETWAANGPPILPLDPYDRALARFWSAYVDDKLYPTFAGILYSDGDEAKRTASLDQARESISLLEKVKCNSKGSKFFGGGNRIGFMDIAVGSYLEWIKVTEKLRNVTLIGETETPNLFRWAQDFRSDVSVKGTLPHTHELLEFAISSSFADRFKASTSRNNN